MTGVSPGQQPTPLAMDGKLASQCGGHVAGGVRGLLPQGTISRCLRQRQRQGMLEVPEIGPASLPSPEGMEPRAQSQRET